MISIQVCDGQEEKAEGVTGLDIGQMVRGRWRKGVVSLDFYDRRLSRS